MATPTLRSASSRLQGIDATRYLGALAVVIIHSLPGIRPAGFSVVGLIDIASRWAVPFFFMASGYFLYARSAPKLVIAGSVVRRIVPVYAFWLACFLTASGSWQTAFGTPRAALGTLGGGGPAYHLWFLPALVVGMLMYLLLDRVARPRLQLAIVVLMLMAGLAFGAYRIVLHLPGKESRAGLFFAYPLVWLGAWTARRRATMSASRALALVALGFVLACLESWLIHRSGGRFGRQDFLIGAGFLGYGAMMLALNEHAALNRLAPLGRVSLGVYCAHPLFLLLVFRITSYEDAGSALLVATAVAVLSTVLALALYRVRALRPLVS